MPPTPARAALRRALEGVHHVTPVPFAAATGTVAEVYRQLEQDFGLLAPPVALHSPSPDLLAASWTMLRETLLADGAASRAAKETVAIAVSQANTCPYCVEVHSATVAGLGASEAADPITDWAGAGGTAESAAGLPVPAEELPELLGVALTFHYVNRVVNVFLGDSPVPTGLPAFMTGIIRTAMGRILRSPGRVTAGRSLDLLPAAELPDDLSWANGSPVVAAALARAVAATDAAADRAVPPDVRAEVSARLETWDARPAVPGAPDSLPDAAPARLAVLVAMSPHRVDAETVTAARAELGGDAELLALVSWAALSAARRIVAAPSVTEDRSGQPA